MSRFALLPLLVFVHPLTWSQTVPLAPATDGQGIDHTHLAVIVNTTDPLSVETGDYYVRQRRIPAVNIIRITFPAGASIMPVAQFARIKATIDALTSPGIQAYSLAWAVPCREPSQTTSPPSVGC